MYTSSSLLCNSNIDKLAPPQYSTDLECRMVKELREWKICLFKIDRAESLKAPWKSSEHIQCSRFYFLLSRVIQSTTTILATMLRAYFAITENSPPFLEAEFFFRLSTRSWSDRNRWAIRTSVLERNRQQSGLCVDTEIVIRRGSSFFKRFLVHTLLEILQRLLRRAFTSMSYVLYVWDVLKFL